MEKGNAEVVAVRNEKYVLIKPYRSLTNVGGIYDIGDLNSDFVLLRDDNTKVARLAIEYKDLKDLNEYFQKVYINDNLTGFTSLGKWSEWTKFNPRTMYSFIDYYADLVGCEIYYRTNMKKVEVKINGYVVNMNKDGEVQRIDAKGKSSCNYKHDEKFNISTGFNLALIRALKKYLIKANEAVTVMHVSEFESVEHAIIEFINKKSE